MFTLASKIRAAIMNDDVAALEKLAAGHDAAKLSVWEGHSGLYTAARKGRPQAARFFLDKGGDPNKNEGYWTPLQCAAYYGRLEIVAMMLKKDGNPNLRDNNEKNARDLAEGRGFAIATINVDHLQRLGEDARFRSAYGAHDLVCADGNPIVWLSRIAGRPVALAPGMGLNAYFAFVLVLAQGYTWQQALAAVFLSGMLFVILSVLPVREAIINAIPRSLKLAVSAGIGLFLGIIALKNAGIVVAHPATFVTLGNLFRWPALLCLLGFVLMVALTQRRVIGAWFDTVTESVLSPGQSVPFTIRVPELGGPPDRYIISIQARSG